MNEEEKKIKEMEELGINLIDSPSETIEVASPTKLKLQALTFMIVGKIERHFLSSRLNQSRQVRNLATTGLKKITSMTDEDKKDFTDKFDSDITILEENLSKFDEYYQRVMGHARRSLRIPSTNFLALKIFGKKAMSRLVEAYKPMNDVFFETKKELDGVELSDKEKSSIRQNVYKALSGGTDEEIERYASGFNDESDKKLDDFVSSRRSKEQGLDDFFNNISPISSSQVKLENDELDHVLNGGKAKKDDVTPKKMESGELDGVLNGNKPILSNEESPIFNDDSPNFTPYRLSVDSDSVKPTQQDDSAFVLSDDDIANLTGKFAERDSMFRDTHYDMAGSDAIFPSGMFLDDEADKLEDVYNDDDSDIVVPDVEDLRRQLEESAREVEQKRLEKTRAETAYEAEKTAREHREEELIKSREELSQMKNDIERKKRKQEDINKLNEKIQLALKIQKQIAENRKQALQEEEETKKYKSSLEEEKESQDEISKKQEAVKSEQMELQKNTEEIDSDLHKKLVELEKAKMELQGFPIAKGGVSFRNADSSFVDIQDGSYVNPPIQGRDEPTPKKR